MERLTIISSDGHIGAPVENYRGYLEPEFREDYDDYLTYRFSRYQEFLEQFGKWYEQRHSALAPAYSESDVHLKGLESDGIVAGVLFPDGGHENEIPFMEAPSSTPLATRWAGARAYNRWLADFCSYSPDRFGGLAVIVSLADVEAAVSEINWAAATPGIRGVVVPTGVELDAGLPPYWDERYDAVWRACADNKLAAHIHAAGGPLVHPVGIPEYPDTPTGHVFGQIEHSFWTLHRPFSYFLLGGILERHPGLHFVFTELGSGWIPDSLKKFDAIYQGPRFEQQRKEPEIRDVLSMAPSEYWRRQGHVGASLSSLGEIERRHDVGVETIMFGSDYPHHGGTTAAYLQATLGASHVPEEEALQMICGNAAELYGFDLDILDALAAEIGPSKDAVLTDDPAALSRVDEADKGRITAVY